MVTYGSFLPEYDQPRRVAALFGVSTSLLQQLIADEKIESFLLRRYPHSRQGVRLVKISSVRDYFESERLKYAKLKAAGELPLVAERGRQVMAANRARRKAQKQAAAKPAV